MVKKKKLPLPLKLPLLKLPLKLLLRWKLLPWKPLLLKLLPLTLLPLTLLHPLLLPSNSWTRNEKPAFGPVFLCLQETIES